MSRQRSRGVGATTHPTVVPPPTSLPLPLRAAFYYPWFGPGGTAGWNQGSPVPFTWYTPTLGYYDSSDPTIISDHIAALQYGKQQAGIASWWGPDPQQGWDPNPPANNTDQVFPLLLAGAVGTQFRWCPYYEKEGNATPPTLSEIEGDLGYILSNYGTHPNFLYIAGKPVIFVYGSATSASNGYLARWVSANANVSNAWYIVLKVYSGWAPTAGISGWHQYGPAGPQPSTGVLADYEDHQVGQSFTISPGYYKRSDASPLLVRNPSLFPTVVSDMVASNEPLQLVTTFNEWGEGTAVESADGANGWSSVSGQGTFLDTLHNVIGGGATAPGVPTGVTATAGNTTANVSWTAPFNGGSAITAYTVTPTGSGSPVTVGNVTSTTVTGLTNGTPVFFTVHATNAIGSSGESAASNTVTPAAVSLVPNAPTNFVANPDRTFVGLTWTAATVPGGSPAVDHYTVTVTPAGGSGSPITTGLVTSLTVNGLTPSTFYSFSITAHNSVGNSSAATVTTTTLAPVPPPSKPGIMFIMMENNDYDNIFSSGQAPYQVSLGKTYVNCIAAWGDSHPSQPNYAAMSSGNGWGMSDGSPAANTIWLGSQLTGAGQSQIWFTEAPSETKHIPPALATGHGGPASVAVTPSGNAATNTSNVISALNGGTVAGVACNTSTFFFLSCTDTHSTHSSSVGAGDSYLSTLIPLIQATTWYGNGGTIIIVYDEAYATPGGTSGAQTASTQTNTSVGAYSPAIEASAAALFNSDATLGIHGGPVPMMLVSNGLKNSSGKFGLTTDGTGFTCYSSPITHIGILQAMQDWYGVGHITTNPTANSTKVGGTNLLNLIKASTGF